jgi:hypothetical protein
VGDYVVGVSEGVTEDLAQFVSLPAEKLRVISNPIVAPEIGELARAPVDHAWFDGDEPVFVAAGRLRPQKDFPTLLRAFSLVRAKRPVRPSFSVKGLSESGSRIIANSGCRATSRFQGHDQSVRVHGAFSTAFILSSRWEGLPTVLIEAMSCDASRRDGLPERSSRDPCRRTIRALVPVGDVRHWRLRWTTPSTGSWPVLRRVGGGTRSTPSSTNAFHCWWPRRSRVFWRESLEVTDARLCLRPINKTAGDRPVHPEELVRLSALRRRAVAQRARRSAVLDGRSQAAAADHPGRGIAGHRVTGCTGFEAGTEFASSRSSGIR